MEIEFRYGVLVLEISLPRAVASDNSSSRRSRALELPEEEVNVLNDSSHSSVSSGSISGRVWRGLVGDMSALLPRGAESPAKACFLNGSSF